MTVPKQDRWKQRTLTTLSPLLRSVPILIHLNPALDINKSLEWNQRASLDYFLSAFKDAFSETSGCTNTQEHVIFLTATSRVSTKIYLVPIHLRPYFEKEIDNLLRLGIIHPSSSPHCSPLVMVRKSDGSYRMAIDFRKLNPFTDFDPEPTFSEEGPLLKGTCTSMQELLTFQNLTCGRPTTRSL